MADYEIFLHWYSLVNLTLDVQLERVEQSQRNLSILCHSQAKCIEITFSKRPTKQISI